MHNLNLSKFCCWRKKYVKLPRFFIYLASKLVAITDYDRKDNTEMKYKLPTTIEGKEVCGIPYTRYVVFCRHRH